MHKCIKLKLRVPVDGRSLITMRRSTLAQTYSPAVIRFYWHQLLPQYRSQNRFGMKLQLATCTFRLKISQHLYANERHENCGQLEDWLLLPRLRSCWLSVRPQQIYCLSSLTNKLFLIWSIIYFIAVISRKWFSHRNPWPWYLDSWNRESGELDSRNPPP